MPVGRLGGHQRDGRNEVDEEAARRARGRCGSRRRAACRRLTVAPPASSEAQRRRSRPASAMSRSKRSRCSGRLMLEMSMCRSWTFSGFTAARLRDRKSACFWLSPSRATRSPGATSASNAGTISSVGRTRPRATLATRSRRRALSSPGVRQTPPPPPPPPSFRLPCQKDRRTGEG